MNHLESSRALAMDPAPSASPSGRTSSPPQRFQVPPLALGFGNGVATRLLRAAYDELAKRLERARKGVEEAGRGVLKASWNRGHGPLHMAASAGNVASCNFLIKELELDVDATGTDGTNEIADIDPDDSTLYAKRALYTMTANEMVRNTVTLSLDGSNIEVLESYMLAIAHMRFWNCSYGNIVDYSSLLGYEKVLYTTPPSGCFHLILKYAGQSIDLVIDARDGWFHGAIGPKGICVLKRNNKLPKYITLEGITVLPYEGQYGYIAPGGIGMLTIGLEALREAFIILVEFDWETDTETPEFKAALGKIVFSICEAYKFHRVHELICNTISEGTTTTVEDSSDPGLAEVVKKWGRFCGVANRTLFRYVHEGIHPNTSELLQKNIGRIDSIEAVLENIIIAPYGSVQPRYFELLPRASDVWSAVDSGKGDPDVTLLGNFDYTALNAWQRSKFLRETEKYLGDRSGGKAHSSAVDFVNRRASWRSPLPLRHFGQVLPKVQPANGFVKSVCVAAKLFGKVKK